MPVRKRKDRRRNMALTLDQRWWLDLGGSNGPGFATEADMRAAWEWHRAAMLERYRTSHAGKRPHAWWRFDSGAEEPPSDDEADALLAMGEMHANEIDRVRKAHDHLPPEYWPAFMRAEAHG